MRQKRCQENYLKMINPKTFQREITQFFRANSKAMSKFRYYCYPPGWDQLENFNQNLASPKWGKTKMVAMFALNSLLLLLMLKRSFTGYFN